MAKREIAHFHRESQLNLANALVSHILARDELRNAKRLPIPDETALFELHRAGMLLLIERAGRYRETPIRVAYKGKTTRRPPPPGAVPALIERFFRDLARWWREGDALDVAAYALWRVAWIHPFENGNGRTAIAFAYACLCLKLGALLPPVHTVPEQIAADRPRLTRILRAIHRKLPAGGKPDLRALKAYLDGLLLRQIAAARRADKGGRARRAAGSG